MISIGGDRFRSPAGEYGKSRAGAPATIPLSVLDLARHAEDLGYRRDWLAEHHNMPGIASAGAAVVIGQVAGTTHRIRVGAGGIMLPNHSPLVVAEQFGTLDTLFPGWIDLGLGRAPGTGQITARALRREGSDPNHFCDEVAEVLALFDEPQPGQAVRAWLSVRASRPSWRRVVPASRPCASSPFANPSRV